MKKLFFAVSLVFVLTGCGVVGEMIATPTLDPCRPEVMEPFLEEIDGFSREFEDAIDLAASTSRINLAGPVGDLQEIRRNVEKMDPP